MAEDVPKGEARKTFPATGDPKTYLEGSEEQCKWHKVFQYRCNRVVSARHDFKCFCIPKIQQKFQIPNRVSVDAPFESLCTFHTQHMTRVKRSFFNTYSVQTLHKHRTSSKIFPQHGRSICRSKMKMQKLSIRSNKNFQISNWVILHIPFESFCTPFLPTSVIHYFFCTSPIRKKKKKKKKKENDET